MKRIISVFVALIISTSLYAATYKQTGYIKEKGSDTHKGKKLSGVKIKVKDIKEHTLKNDASELYEVIS
mgnify:CR=1 FL=1